MMSYPSNKKETNYFIFRESKGGRFSFSKSNDDYWLSEDEFLNTTVLGNQVMDAPGFAAANTGKYTLNAMKISFRQIVGVVDKITDSLKGDWRKAIRFNVPDVTGVSKDVLKKGFHMHFKQLDDLELTLKPIENGKMALGFLSGNTQKFAEAVSTFNKMMGNSEFRTKLLVSLKATQEALIDGSKVLKNAQETQMAIDKAHEMN